MGKFFSDKTEQAVDLLYTQYEKEGFQKAKDLLMQAAQEGDADALYFLHRCLMGKQFVWQYAGFEEDQKKARELLNQSVQKGSALAVIGSMRSFGLTSAMRQSMPFRNVKEAWAIVQDMAEKGHPFYQHTVGCAYYGGDIIEIEDLSREEVLARYREFMDLAEHWFERCIKNGYNSCTGNLLSMYEHGEGPFPANPQKYRELMDYCIKRGDPEQLSQHSSDCYNQEKYEDCLYYAKLAVEKGQLDAYHEIARLYEWGYGVEKDMQYALQCYQLAAEAGCEYAYSNLGRVYFNEEEDWGKAFYWLEKAAKAKRTYSYAYLATCYLKGLGTQQDYAKALHYFERANDGVLKFEGLGAIYTDGLGVAEDIPKGVQYLLKAKADGSKEAAANLACFKKSLFGGWKRR